ncbi:MBL fold metallo-hydrolase [Priestia taiwanensis]|uniref:MBL fold metallo-hydrolase n=1 Tax=Priestia taiwanensis TaxID=1347902 RepID=UPI00166953A9|nr:MBL fold metallo-hydrolase [Priestia taiwanensis]
MEGIYRISLPVPYAIGNVNVYLIEGETLTLVDTGTKTEKCRDALESELSKLGYAFDDIKTVVITHHHPDHCGMLDYFADDVTIVGHPRNEPWITQEPTFMKAYEGYFQTFARQMGVPVQIAAKGPDVKRTLIHSCHRPLTKEVREGDIIEALPEFVVIETPGHASTHISLYRERDGLLIGGDLLLAHVSSNPLLEPPMYDEIERPKVILQYNESLRRLAEMNISRILTGHGEDVINVKELVKERLGKQRLRAEKVYDMLQVRPMTAFEVCMKLFPTLYLKQGSLTLSETVGQLDYLEYHNRIVIDTSKEQWLFYAK